MQSLFILNDAGNIIVEKHYRGYVDRSICSYFWDEVLKYASRDEVPPVMVTPSTVLVHTQHNNLFLLFTVSKETSPLYVIEYLHRIVEIFTKYMESLTEYNLRSNLVTAYQILDETMDFGVPLTTEPGILLDIVKPSTTLRKAGSYISTQLVGKSIQNVQGELPQGSMGNIRWRRVGIKHSTNEFYVDIIEELQATIQKSGKTENAKILGSIMANSLLSGMPDMTLNFTNPGILLDVSFHPCVRYAKYERERVVSFIPPDGQFKLLSYRSHIPASFRLPLSIRADFDWKGSSCQFDIAVVKIEGIQQPEEIEITIPFPKTSASARLNATTGSVRYNEISKICVWSLGKIPKDKDASISGAIENASGDAFPGENPTLLLNFKISQLAVSGLQVKSLSVDNISYKKVFKGVKSFSKGGDHLQYRT